MKIIDNFLMEADWAEMEMLLRDCKDPVECPNDEQDHKNLNRVDLFLVTGEAKERWMKHLSDSNIITEAYQSNPDYQVRYHITRSPYYSNFHCDRTTDWHSDVIDYVGITFFLNNGWHHNDGGCYCYKQSWDHTQGTFVEPLGNRLIVNTQDLPHAVTQITNPNVARHSIQMFIAKELLR